MRDYSRLPDDTTLEQLKNKDTGFYNTGESTILPKWSTYIVMGSEKIIRITNSYISNNGLYRLNNNNVWKRVLEEA